VRRLTAVCLLALVVLGVDSPVAAQDEDAETTISALQTRVAVLEEELDAVSSTAEAEERATSTPRPRTPTPTPRPRTPTTEPTPTFDEIVANYPPIPDIRELSIRPGNLIGEQIAFSGTVLTINVAAPGRVFVLGDDDPAEYAAQLQIQVPAPDGSTEAIFIGYDGDTEGIFEGSYVTVYGTVVGTQSFENTLGGGVTQPLVDAELVVIA
jgi:hypothetical protein